MSKTILSLAALCSCLISSGYLVDGASPVNITLSARNLPLSDPINGSPDPYVKVFYSFGSSGKFELIGETAALADTQNPIWKDVIKVDDFVPGTSQQLKFEVWDDDFDGDDLLGTAQFYLAELSNSANRTVEKELNIQGNGFLIVNNVAV